MCFSATASFTAGVALLGIGTLTLRRAERVAELPYATIPALFGLQQLVEGGLWLTFLDKSPHLNSILTHVYSLFSHVLWPIFVPIAVLLLEAVPWRRNVLKALAIAGRSRGFISCISGRSTQPLRRLSGITFSMIPRTSTSGPFSSFMCGNVR